MAATDTWRTLVDGAHADSEGVVLAVDFDTTGRVEARFADLVANMGPAFEVRESVPPPALAGRQLSGADYVDYWAAPLEAERSRVHAVLGFCGGAIYAAPIAERVGRIQGRTPELILFDPELSTAQTLFWQFHKIMGFLAGTLSAQQIAEAREIGQAAFDRIPEAVPLKDELMRQMRELGGPALVALGLDEKRREELFGVFESFLSYLAAASEIDPREAWSTAVAFNSATPLSGLNAMRSSGVQITVGKEVGIEAEHGTLLSDKGVAAAVLELLRA